MVTIDSFIAEIDAFLQVSGMSPTAFGKAAVGDPCFVSDLRVGRMPGLRIVDKVCKYIKAQSGSSKQAAE